MSIFNRFIVSTGEMVFTRPGSLPLGSSMINAQYHEPCLAAVMKSARTRMSFMGTVPREVRQAIETKLQVA